MLADDIARLARSWKGCAACSLADGRTSVVFGRAIGELRTGGVLAIGEAPGEVEDQTGEPFRGPSGQFLEREMFAPAGLTDCYITNAVLCRPPANRTPREDEVVACWAHLEQILALLRPKVVLAIGKVARDHLVDLANQYKIPMTAVIHPSWFLRQGGVAINSNPVTRGKLTMEVVKIRRMLSGMAQKPEEPPSEAEDGDVLFGNDPPPPACQHDFVVVGRIKKGTASDR